MDARHCFAAAFLALALVQSPAAADVSDVDRATARTLTLEGYEALDRKDYATAADRFARADALYHVPTVALGLAHAQVGLGKLVGALATYSRIVREGVPPNAPPAFVKAVEDSRREIEALMQRIPSVIIVVRGASEPKVMLDGVEVPAAALGVKRPVDPGTHVVHVTAAGALPGDANVTILEGKVETVTIELKPAPVSQVPVVPAAPAQPPPAAPPAAPPAEAPSGGSTQKTLGFVAIGLGGAGLGLGAITGGLALSKHSSLIDQCPSGHCKPSQQASLQSDVDSYHTLGALSTAGFIAGGALLGAGVILVLTAPKPKYVAPVLGLGYAGVEGRF